MTPNEGPGLSLTEWVVLGLLSEAPSHGFAVARSLSRATALGQVWTVPRPLVYRAIGRLEEQGMIAVAGEEPGEPGPPRMVYHATGKGKKAVAQWRGEPVQHLREVRSAFLAKVLLRQRAGEVLAPLVADQRAVFEPLFQRLADQFTEREGDRVVASWRYESSQAVARLLDQVEGLDLVEQAMTPDG
ncbi:MAG TPA: PadR family transcriptional regulator [Acidimicrobiia bacterium]|nr:PadR family transcriptional regulator [Acidimicrobiia bacterium]